MVERRNPFMIPSNAQTENYNETVLIPVLQDKVTMLMNQTILLEAKLQIAEKQKAEIEKRLSEVSTSLTALQAAQVLQPNESGEQNAD